MDFELIDERFRRCTTLAQALLAVNALAVTAGTIDIKNRAARAVVEFQANRITSVTLLEPHESGQAALDKIVSMRNCRCLYLAPGSQPPLDDPDEELPQSEAAPQSASLLPAAATRTADDAGIRDAIMRSQLRSENSDGSYEELLQRHRAEFLQTNSDAPALLTQTHDPLLPPMPLEGEAGYGLAVIGRAGFSLLPPDEQQPSVEQALAECTSLLDALLTVGSMRLKDGILDLTTAQVSGAVEFHSRKITRAMISGSEQTGEPALKILIALSGVTCRYTELPELPPAKEANGGAAALESPGKSESTVAAFSGDSKGISGALLRHQLRVDDGDAHDDVRERQQVEFSAQDARMGELDAPIRRDIHYVRTRFDAAEKVDDRDALALARAGFVWDFHDVAPRRSTKEFLRGDPAAQPAVVEFKISRTEHNVRKYVMPAVVVALCVAIYAVPALLWPAADGVGEKERQQRLARMADGAYDSLDDGNAIRTTAFELPQGRTGPLPAAPATTFGAAPDDSEPSPFEGPDPSDAKEFSLAYSQSTLPRLEQLIHKYIAKKKFRRARDLALAGLRSSTATVQDRRRFFDLYRLCMSK